MKSTVINEENIIKCRAQIGARLQDIRKAKGISIDLASELLKMSKPTISKVEAGKWNYNIEVLIQFSIAYEFDIELILK